MKKINELSDKEILALTDEQLDKMVKLEMAEKGIKILENPNQPKYEELPAKTEIGYNVSGISYVISDKDTADKLSVALSEASKHMVNTNYVGNDYKNKYVKRLENYVLENIGKVTTEHFYDRKTLESINTVIGNNKQLEEAYTQEVSEYNEAYDAASAIREEIYGKRNEVDNKYYSLNKLKSSYDNYLQLADGNAKTAMKFLKNAFVVSEEAEKFVVDGKVDNNAPVIEGNS